MFHFINHGLVEVRIKPSVIAQHRVYHNQTVRSAEVINKVRNNMYLPRRTQIAGIKGIKLHFQLLPLGNNLRHFIRQVQKKRTPDTGYGSTIRL